MISWDSWAHQTLWDKIVNTIWLVSYPRCMFRHRTPSSAWTTTWASSCPSGPFVALSLLAIVIPLLLQTLDKCIQTWRGAFPSTNTMFSPHGFQLQHQVFVWYTIVTHSRQQLRAAIRTAFNNWAMPDCCLPADITFSILSCSLIFSPSRKFTSPSIFSFCSLSSRSWSLRRSFSKSPSECSWIKTLTTVYGFSLYYLY